MENDVFEGNLQIKKSGVYNYRKVTGYVHVNANAEFPKLETVGGGVYVHTNSEAKFPKLTKKNDAETALNLPSKCRAILLSSFAALGYSFADGILARIVSQRGNVTRVIVCGKTEISYVVTNGEAFSHGKTLKEARDGLMYKIGSRDTSEFKKWSLNRVVSKADAIKAHRVITGACEAGVRQWMGQRETPEKIMVKGIIDITKGAYGNETFQKFFAEAKQG